MKIRAYEAEITVLTIFSLIKRVRFFLHNSKTDFSIKNNYLICDYPIEFITKDKNIFDNHKNAVKSIAKNAEICYAKLG